MSSLVFLAISMIMFIIIFGMMYTLAPMILGAFFTAMPGINMDASWTALNTNVQTTIKLLLSITPAMGVVIIFLKVFMVSTVRGAD